MAGEENESRHEIVLSQNLDSASVADRKNLHAIELITLELQGDDSLSESEENQEFNEKHKFNDTPKPISHDDYFSSDDRNLFQNKLLNGFDVLTLTTVRIFLQVAYQEFTGENTVPFMARMTEEAALAGPIVAILCLFAFMEIYQAYQHQQAKKLRNDPAQLAKFRQDLELEATKKATHEQKQTAEPTKAKAQIEKLQKKVDLILAEDAELQEKYTGLSVKYKIEGNQCKVYLVAAPKLQPQESTKEKGINWPNVGSVAWNILNISALVYWVEWGLRNLVKPGGFGVGFGSAMGMNVVIPFGIVLPVMVPLAMLAPTLFNYINNNHNPTNKASWRFKFWDGVKKLFKPTPNPLQGSKFQFLGYIVSEVANFFRHFAGFFLVAPTMLGIGVNKLLPSGKKTATVNEATTDNASPAAKVAENDKEFSKQFTEDAASILSRVILLEKYEKAGVTLTQDDLQSGQRKADESETTSPQSDESPLILKSSSQSELPKQDVSDKSKGERRGKFSWLSLFALKTGVGYVFLQFTLGWWLIDLIDIFNPGVDIVRIATITAGVILGLSVAYGLVVMLNRKREYDEYYQPFAEIKDAVEREKKQNYQKILEKVQQAERNAKETEKQAPTTKTAQKFEDKNCPKIDDARYYADIRISEKTRPWYGDYQTVAFFTLWLGVMQTGVWLGRGSSIPGTAIHPGIDPWNSVIPWENKFSELDKHLIVVATVLLVAGLFFAAYRHNYKQDQIIEGEKQKVKQAGERLLHTKLVQTTFFHANNKGSTTPTETRTDSPELTPPSSPDLVEDVPLLSKTI